MAWGHAAWLGAVLLLAACLPLPLARSAVLDVNAPDLGGGTINVCTSEYSPIVFCQGRDPEQYSGYEIEVFHRVRRQLGWEQERVNLTCMAWEAMMASLAAGDGVCDLAVAGVDIAEDYMLQGIIFTFPTLSTGGYRILVPAEESSVDTWAFMDAFSWELWVAIICTMVAMGCIVWAVERWANLRRPPPGAPPPPSLQKQVWTALGRPMQTTEMTSRNFAGNLIIMIFAFMMLILVTLYTANTAANLTATRLSTNIRSVEDLPGKRVGTWEDDVYMNDLEKRGIIPKAYPWADAQDEQAMFDAVANREVDALVLDLYVLDWNAASRCDVRVVGNVWEQYDQAVAFSSAFDVDSPVVKDYNKALVQLKQAGDMEALVDQYVTPPEAACKSRGVSESSKVTFKEVAGLWILLACSVGMALLLVIVSQLALHSARRVARTQAFQSSVRRVQTLRGTRQVRGGGTLPGRAGAVGSGAKEAPQGGECPAADVEGQRMDSALGAAAPGGDHQAAHTHRVSWALPSTSPPDYPPAPASYPPPPLQQQQPERQQDAAQLSARMDEVLAAVQHMQQLLQARGPPPPC